MTPLQAEELLSLLKQTPCGLDELHQRVRLWGSAWTPDQLELFLRCAPGVTRDATGRYCLSVADQNDDLRAALLDAMRSFAGKPVPAEQLRARLPQNFVTTDEQIRAVARRMPELRLVGPGLLQLVSDGRR